MTHKHSPVSASTSAPSGSQDQYDAIVVDISTGRSGHHERVDREKKSVAVVVLEQPLGTEFLALCARQRIRCEHCARVVLRAVDAVCIAGQSVYVGKSIQIDRK